MDKELSQLGFSKDESKVYIALLELGTTTAGPTAKSTGLFRQSVYNALEKLEARGFVSVTTKSNRKYFTASNPEEVVSMIQGKLSLAQAMLPRLLLLQSKGDYAQQVQVYEGYSGFKLLHRQNIKMQPADSEVLVIGGTGWRWIESMKKARYFRPFERARMEKNISLKLVFFENDRKEMGELINKVFVDAQDKNRFYKYLPDEYIGPIGMQIWDTSITLVIYGDGSPVVIKIQNALIVDNFKNHFEIMWRLAKK